MRTERARTGAAQPAHERPRGNRSRRWGGWQRPTSARGGGDRHSRRWVGNRARAPVAGARALFHDQAERQRSRIDDLPIDCLGRGRHQQNPVRAGQRNAGGRHGPAGARSAAAGVMKPSRILVVDDEPGMLRAIERVLGGKHHVIGSGSSREAASIALDFRPELAILDIRMPELDGFELMARLKALQPDLDVILMTGSLEDQDEKLVRAIKGRAFYFIQKPFDREVLKTLVDRCLDLRWHRAENRRHVQRLEAELADARAFQQGLLPSPEALINGLEVHCRYTPCSELGGDLYDYAQAPDGRTALLIADVVGHGASAAIVTGIF